MGELAAAARRIVCRAVLFDLDGVLIDSAADFHRHWLTWARHHGIDGEATFEVGHGLRTADHIRLVAPHLDADSEAHRFEEMEVHDAGGTAAVAGASELVAELPPGRWAVVTSSIRSLAMARLRAAGLPTPDVLVCADDVTAGKPDPEGYARAIRALGVHANQAVVVEDSPAGVAAGQAAGAFVIAVLTTHSAVHLAAADVVAPLTRISAESSENGDITVLVGRD
jgi:mannitol-1-/sugar-/sorbitol-6-phosphatase